MANIQFWTPSRQDEAASDIGGSTFVMDATGEIAALVMSVPKTGNLTRFEAYLAVETNTPDNGLLFSFQDLDLATGLPDGTPDQSATIASGSINVGWLDPGDFDSPRAVTVGDLVALVVSNPSFTVGDSVTIGALTMSSDLHFPFGVSATSTKQTNVLPIFALRYDDGTYGYICPELWPVQAISAWPIQSDTTPDEIGLAFSVPRSYVLKGFSARLRPTTGTAGLTYDAVVYDSGGSVVATQTIDADVSSSLASTRLAQWFLDTPVTLTANSLYRLTFKPASSTVNFSMTYHVFPGAAYMDAIENGSAWYACARTDAGSWTDYNNGTDGYRRPALSLFLEDTGAGSGGGILRPVSQGGGLV